MGCGNFSTTAGDGAMPDSNMSLSYDWPETFKNKTEHEGKDQGIFFSFNKFFPPPQVTLWSFIFTLRIYEQLPEVRKRREEEKRKSEYNSYRLKAQLYKMVGVLS